MSSVVQKQLLWKNCRETKLLTDPATRCVDVEGSGEKSGSARVRQACGLPATLRTHGTPPDQRSPGSRNNGLPRGRASWISCLLPPVTEHLSPKFSLSGKLVTWTVKDIPPGTWMRQGKY